MKTASIIGTVVFLLCLAALPIIRYLGGRQCFPLVVPPLFPAEVVPLGIGLVTAIPLIVRFVASLVTGRDRKWTFGALAVVVATATAFWFSYQPATAFLYGLRDRFVGEVGYPSMRQFAAELSQDESLMDAESVLYPPGWHGIASAAERKRWDDLVARYPFLAWNGGARALITGPGSVELFWGSAPTGHWGFEVATPGTLSVPEEDRGQALKIADDLQFVSYYD